MKKLSTLVKLATLFVIGGGTIGAAVGISEASTNPTHLEDGFVAEAETTFTDRYVNETKFLTVDLNSAPDGFKNNRSIWIYFLNGPKANTSLKMQIDTCMSNRYYTELIDFTDFIIVSCDKNANEMNWPGDSNRFLQTEDISLTENNNSATIYGWNNVSGFLDETHKCTYVLSVSNKPTGIVSGDKMYLYSKYEVGADWGYANSNFGFRFFDHYNSIHADSAICVPATGDFSNIEYLYETIVPEINGQKVVFPKLIGLRIDPKFDEINWSNGSVWTETQHIEIKNNNYNVLRPIADDGKNTKLEHIDNFYSAIDLSNEFLNTTSTHCDPQGISNNEIANEWPNIKTNFESKSDLTIWLLKNTKVIDADAKPANKLEDAVRRYSYIVNKYRDNNQFNDFLGKRTSQASNLNAIGGIEDSGTIVITSVAVLSTTAIAMFAFISKKKRLFK